MKEFPNKRAAWALTSLFAIGAGALSLSAVAGPVSSDSPAISGSAETLIVAKNYSRNPKFYGQQIQRRNLEKADVARFESRTHKAKSTEKAAHSYRHHQRHLKGH